MYGTAAQEAITHWVNEKESPYVEETPLHAWRAYQLSGRSIL